MSLKILKAGIYDTVQDRGRYGYQARGINPNGAIDQFSAQLANSVLGKPGDSPVFEFYFPAPVIYFEKSAIICLSGADFGAEVDYRKIQLNTPVVIKKE